LLYAYRTAAYKNSFWCGKSVGKSMLCVKKK
jgi:hypothetical protein